MSRRIRVIQTSWVLHHPGIPIGSQAHPYPELIYILRGTYRVKVGGKLWAGEAGDVFFFPAGMVHQPLIVQDRRTQMFVCWWEPDRRVARMGNAPKRAKDHDGRLLGLVQWLLDLNVTPSPYAELRSIMTEALIWGFFERARTKSESAPSELLDRAIYEMGLHLENPRQVSEMAALTGLSRQHFTRSFRAKTGCTPQSYIRQKRIEYAKHLLDRTGLTQKEIAARVGLKNPASLWRFLKN